MSDKYRVDKPRPFILHTGERVLNRNQTKALDRLQKQGKVKLPKGAKKPKAVSLTEVKKVYKMIINKTKRGRKTSK